MLTDTPQTAYIPLSDIPSAVKEAAEGMHNFFEKQGLREWQFSHVADRRLVIKLERDIAELNERLIDRQQTVMALGIKLMEAERRLEKYEKA